MQPGFIPIKLTDAVQLHELAHKIYVQHYTDLWLDGGEGYLGKSFSVDQLSKEIKNDHVRYFFVQTGSKTAGFLKFILPSDDAKQQGLYLERLYLDNACTGQGLGGQCLTLANSFATEADLKRIWLQAMTYREDVCRFYQRHGYTVCGETLLPATDIVPGREKMLVMEKIIKSTKEA